MGFSLLRARSVRNKSYTQKTPFPYAEVVQAQRKLIRKGVFYGNEGPTFSSHKVVVQVSYRFYTQIQAENNIFELRESIREILRDLCRYKGVDIIEGHLMPDHVHMLVSIPPKISVSSFMGYLKGKSPLMIFDRHANLKYKFGNRKFWAEGYYVSTVGLNEATIKKYIQQQERHDIMQDKLTTREYANPFKG